VAGVTNSGSTSASTLAIESNGGGDNTLVISNNQAYQYNNHGILLSFVDDQGKTANINMTIDGNTVNTPGAINTDFNAFHLNNGATSGPPAPGDDFSSCVDIKNNNFTGGGKGVTPPNNGDVRLRQRIITTVRLPGYTGANNDNTAVINYLRPPATGVKNNSFNVGAAANTVSTGGGGFTNTAGGAQCTQPSFASLASVTFDETNPNSVVTPIQTNALVAESAALAVESEIRVLAAQRLEINSADRNDANHETNVSSATVKARPAVASHTTRMIPDAFSQKSSVRDQRRLINSHHADAQRTENRRVPNDSSRRAPEVTMPSHRAR